MSAHLKRIPPRMIDALCRLITEMLARTYRGFEHKHRITPYRKNIFFLHFVLFSLVYLLVRSTQTILWTNRDIEERERENFVTNEMSKAKLVIFLRLSFFLSFVAIGLTWQIYLLRWKRTYSKLCSYSESKVKVFLSKKCRT